MLTKNYLLGMAIYLTSMLLSAQNRDQPISDQKWKTLAEKREYQLLSEFDTLSHKPLRVYAMYMKDNKFGLINSKGKAITKPLYDEFPDLQKHPTQRFFGPNPWLIVKSDGLYGLIDFEGKEILPVKYTSIYCEGEYVTPAPNTYKLVFKWYEIDSFHVSCKMDAKGLIFDRVEKRRPGTNNGSSGSGNRGPGTSMVEGDWERREKKDEYPDLTWGQEQRTLASLESTFYQNRVYDAQKQKYGFIDKVGKDTILPIVYDRIALDHLGRIHVTQYTRKFDSFYMRNMISETKMGMYSMLGVEIFPPVYKNIEIHLDVYLLTKDGKTAIYDTLLNPISDYIYDEKKGPRNPVVMSLAINGKYALFNRYGKRVTAFEFDKISLLPERGLPFSMIMVTKNGKQAIMDPNGKYYTGFEYERIIAECHVSAERGISVNVDLLHLNQPNTYFFVRQNNLWGIMDTTYNLIVECIYQDIVKCRDPHFILTRKEGKWAIWRWPDLKTILPEEFEKKPEMSRDFFIINKDEKYGVINKDGTYLHETTITSRPYCDYAYPGLISIRHSYWRVSITTYIDKYANRVTLTRKY